MREPSIPLSPHSKPKKRLLRVELDHHALFHRRSDVIARRKVTDSGLHRSRVELQPLRDLATLHALESSTDTSHGAALLANLDDVALTHQEARHIDALAIDHEMAVANELASFIAGIGETRSISDVIKTALKHREQIGARNALHVLRLLEKATELLLKHPVDALDLLLLTKLKAILRELDAALAMLARRITTTFERALLSEATVALQKELLILTTAKTAN